MSIRIATTQLWVHDQDEALAFWTKKVGMEVRSDVTVPELESRLRTIFETRKDKTMFIAGAGNLRYGDIVEVIDAAKGAGVEKVGIVTEAMRRAAGASGSN